MSHPSSILVSPPSSIRGPRLGSEMCWVTPLAEGAVGFRLNPTPSSAETGIAETQIAQLQGFVWRQHPWEGICDGCLYKQAAWMRTVLAKPK